MRVIPKRTKVRLELFKGVEVIDVLVGSAGLALAVSVFLSNLPGHFLLSMIIAILTVGMVIPLGDDKGYLFLFYLLKYLGRKRVFKKKNAKDDGTPKKKGILDAILPSADFSIEDITPFTGIDGKFIEYGSAYSAVVLSIPSVEFRFFSEMRQDSVIDRCFAAVLRTASLDEMINLVKIDRPVIYDDFIKNEHKKINDLKEAYLNGLLEEEELTIRVGIIYDRIAQLETFDYKEKIYQPQHYLMFCYKDRDFIQSQIENAIQTFATNNMECKQLEGKELAVFLKYQYDMVFDEREVEKLDPSEWMDWILPDTIKFTTRTVQFDDLITHNFRFRDYPTIVSNAWGAGFFNKIGTRVVMKMTPIERYKAVRQIDQSIDELREQESSTGKTSKIMEVGTHIDTLAEVLRLLQGENEILFNVCTFVQARDYELSEHMADVEAGRAAKAKGSSFGFKKEVRRELAEEGFKVTDNMLQQFEAYASAMPSAYDAFKKYQRGIHSSSVAAVFPYVYKALCDANGLFVGQSGGVPVFIDFFRRDSERVNSNTVIIGKSGSGKSYATKTILTQLAAENSKIFILDPENEYTKLAANMDGKIIDVGTATQGRLNPFHVITGLADDEGNDEEAAANSFSTHLQFLEEFYRQILPGLDGEMLELLNNVTTHVYLDRNIDSDTDLSKLTAADFPTFDDLHERVLDEYQTTGEGHRKELLGKLITHVSKFATGGRNSALWNGEATISTKENFIVFNFQSLLANKNGTIANAQMLLVLKWLDNEIIKNREYNMRYNAQRKIVIVIDEAHVFIDSKYPIALDFMFQLAKRIRKYNGMQIVITQNIKDFVGTEELARKSTAIINASQYSFIFPLAPNDMDDLCKLYEKAGAINESEQEDIINNGRGRAFVITSPQERTTVNIVAAKGIEDLFTMT
ncbi:MAG: ATP-binding protein [Lachnospiraceae bacterium]|nr:ATP-binding protein [Lachnospiraceae bacterium]